MLRPVESHDRLAGRELADRVQKLERVPEAHSRDFSLLIRDTEDDDHKRQSPKDAFGEDRYEASEDSDKQKSQDEPQPPSQQRKGADSGSLDVVA